MFHYGLLQQQCGSQQFHGRVSEDNIKGPDDTKVVDTGNGILGFHRLAIMGLAPSGMQPFNAGRQLCGLQWRNLRI